MLKRAFMTMAAAAAVTAALTFGAAAAENEKIQAGGLVFEIPAEYKDLVTVQTEGLQPDELIRVSETASIEAAKANGEDREGAGWLFSISRIPENELKRLRCGDIIVIVAVHPNIVWSAHDAIIQALVAVRVYREELMTAVRRRLVVSGTQLHLHCSVIDGLSADFQPSITRHKNTV